MIKLYKPDIDMAQRIKQIHPDYVLIFKVGAFCNTFGKDSYIMY